MVTDIGWWNAGPDLTWAPHSHHTEYRHTQHFLVLEIGKIISAPKPHKPKVQLGLELTLKSFE